MKTLFPLIIFTALAASTLLVGDGSAATLSNTLIVDSLSDGQNAGRGTTYPFSTLASALAAANSGDTIEMRPGVYKVDPNYTSTLVDGLTINGYGASLVAADSATASQPNRLKIPTNNITINGLTVDGGPPSGINPDTVEMNVGKSAIFITGMNAHLKDVTVMNCTSIGLFIQGNAQDCVVEGLTSTNCFTHVFVQQDSSHWPTGLKIRNPHLSGTPGTGEGSAGIKMQCELAGITDSRCEIVNADIDSTDQMGIEAQGTMSRVAVRGAKIYHTAYGVSCAAPEMLVTGCQIKGFTFIGIEAASTNANHCTLEGNILDGLLRDGTPASTTAVGYEFSGNVDNVVVQGGTDRDAALLTKFDGVGKVVFQGVLFRPVAHTHVFEAQATTELTCEDCHIVSPTDGSNVSKVWFWSSNVTDPTQAPLLSIRNTTVDVAADENVVLTYTTVAGAQTNLKLENIRCIQPFCGGGFIASQGDISTPSRLVQGCSPATTLYQSSQYGWANTTGFAEGIIGNTLSLAYSGYGGQLTGNIVQGVGGETHLQGLDNYVATDALIIRHDSGPLRIHTAIPLSVDSTILITGQSNAPATPASGSVVLWVDSTGVLHAKDANGNVHNLW